MGDLKPISITIMCKSLDTDLLTNTVRLSKKTIARFYMPEDAI